MSSRDDVWTAMSSAKQWCARLVLTSLVLVTTLRAQPTEEAPPPSPNLARHQFLGSASCAASGCHGGTSDLVGPRYAAHRIWLKQDKHAQAYAVLHNERSRRMVASLGWKAAHQEQRCLACHAVSESPETSFGKSFELSDGVSCEACHGPSEHWIRDHSRPQIWRSLTAAQKQDLGFRETDDFLARAKLCASCHVGDELREVNHDMIAAGHPRLDFEFAGFSALYKKHWDVHKDHEQARRLSTSEGNDAQSTLDARLWLVGQFVSAQSAVKLTETRVDRARSANSHQPWPELTEYGCFSCHHDLQASSWRRQRRTETSHLASRWDDDPAGTMVWHPWLLAYAAEPALSPEARLAAALQPTRQAIRPARPRLEAVVATVPAANKALDIAVLQGMTDPLTPARLRELTDAVTATGTPLDRDWEGATQAYLAVVALTTAQRSLAKGTATDIDFAKVDCHLKKIQSLLAFPQATDSPATFSICSAKKIRHEFDEIRKAFGLPVP